MHLIVYVAKKIYPQVFHRVSRPNHKALCRLLTHHTKWITWSYWDIRD